MKLCIANSLRRIAAPMEFSLSEAVAWDYPEATLANPVSFAGECIWNGNYVAVNAGIEAQLNASCDRCLENFEMTLEIPVSEVFLKGENDPGEPDAYAFSGDTLDFDEMICHNILLSLPSKLLCCEQCKGLCQICGANKNIGQCSCANEINDK